MPWVLFKASSFAWSLWLDIIFKVHKLVPKRNLLSKKKRWGRSKWVSERVCVCVCVCVCVFYPMPCPSPMLDLALEPPGRITVDTKLLLPGKGFGLLKLRGILPWTFPKENLSPGRFLLLFELRMQEQGFSYLILKLLIELEFVTLKGKLRSIAFVKSFQKDSAPIRRVWLVFVSHGWASHLPLTFELSPWDPTYFSPWASKAITTWCHGGILFNLSVFDFSDTDSKTLLPIR